MAKPQSSATRIKVPTELGDIDGLKTADASHRLGENVDDPGCEGEGENGGDCHEDHGAQQVLAQGADVLHQPHRVLHRLGEGIRQRLVFWLFGK